MDVNANNHGKKGIVFFGANAHIMKMLISRAGWGHSSRHIHNRS